MKLFKYVLTTLLCLLAVGSTQAQTRADKNQLPTTTVYTDQNATFGAFTFDFSGANGFRPQSGTTAAIPATCVAGKDVYLANDATPGQNWYFCTSTNTWTQQLNSASNPVNPQFSGQNPFVDITAPSYKARAVTIPEPNTTVTISGSSTTATLASASTFQNGDGVMLVGAGATNVMSTPGSPTVTPSETSGPTGTGQVVGSPAAATTYNYQIVARDQNGGLTAASSVGTTNTGQSTLGSVSCTITSLLRSNNTVTATLAAPCPHAQGAVVYIHDATDATFSGYFIIASAADTTHFTYTQGIDTRVTGATTSATGGTAQIYICNHLTWSAVTGAFQYYIYRGSALIGVSRPKELFFDDYGLTFMNGVTLPDYVPSTPPVSATNDNLSTTISSGGGTTTLTLANAAGNGVSGAVIKFDDAPAILAAATAAVASGTQAVIHLPPSSTSGAVYVVNSYLVLPASLSVWQQWGLKLNETVQYGSNTTWFGDVGAPGCNAPQFSWVCGLPITVNTANPGLYGTAGGTDTFRGLTFNANSQGTIMVVDDAAAFNNTFRQDNFNIGSGGNDYMGMAVVLRGTTQNVFDQVLFSTSDSATFGASLTPLLYVTNDLTNSNGAGSVFLRQPFFIGRGVGVVSNPAIGSKVQYSLDRSYSQALRSPAFMINTANRNDFISFTDGENDTTTDPYVANWSTGLTVEMHNMGGLSSEAGGVPGMVTGNSITNGFTDIGNRGPFGQNVNAYKSQYATTKIPVYSGSQLQPITTQDNRMEAPLHFPGQHTLYWDLPIVTGLTATVASGGAATAGSWTFEVTGLGADGGESLPSSPSAACVTSGGNLTCNEAWTGDAGATAYNVYASLNGGIYGKVTACFNITAVTCSFTGTVDNSVTTAQSGSTGLTTVMQNKVITPSLVLTSPSPATASFTGTLAENNTAARTYTFPDATGTVCITTTCGGQFYQTVLNNGAAKPQEPAIDVIAGTNMTINCVDNAAVKTACTFIASSSASTQFASITASTDSNAGTFAATGNAWDFSGATSFKLPSAGVILPGSASGTATIVAPAAAGTPTITLGTSSGTPAVTASAPLGITTATGNITCTTCATTTNGGALSGTAPIAISAAGAISITAATTGALGSIEVTNDLGGSGTAPTVLSTHITSATTNKLSKFNATGNVVNSSVTDTGTLLSLTDIVDLTNQPLVTEVANEAITGTTLNKWVSLTGAPSTVIITTHNTTGSIGIVAGGAGTTSNAEVTLLGQVACVFDGGTTAGHFVSQSTSVDGDCTDAGTTAPTGMPVAYVLSTNAGVGTYTVALTGGSGAAGSGSGTVNNCATSGGVAYYASNGTAVSCLASVIESAGHIDLGVANTTAGTLGMFGSTSGKVTIATQNVAGTYNFNLPTTAGTTGNLLTSGGGAGNPMTYTSPSITITGQTCTLGSTCTTDHLQTNTVDNANQNLLNFNTSTGNTIGLTNTPVNSSGGIEKIEITGTTTPTGGGTGISVPTAHSLLITEGAAAMNLLTSPATNGLWVCGFNVSASAGVDPTCGLQGIPVLTPTTPYTGLYSDRGTAQRLAGGTTFTWTAPPITGNTAFNMPILFLNNNSGNLTFTANAADKVNGGSLGGSYSTFPNWATFMYQDSTSSPGNWWPLTIPQYGAFTNTGANSAVTFNNVTGAFGALSNISNCSPTRAGDVAYWNGSAYACLAGNNSGTQFLQENASGVPSWNTVAGSGTVTSVGLTVNATSPSGIFTVTGSPVTTSGTLNFNLAGTSGGIPYFSSSTVMSSSAALTHYGVVYGGGAAGAPVSTAADTTTTDALFATATAPAFRAITLGDIFSATGAIGTLANGNNPWTLNCAQTSNSQNCVTFGETSAATGGTLGNQYELKISTASGSTGVPLNITDSLSGSQTLPALHVTPTWNTTGVVDAGILENVTNTASGANSLLLDLQVGGTSQFKVDKAGNTTATGAVAATSANFTTGPVTVGAANCTVPGTAGGLCMTEGTAATNVSGTTEMHADSTTHEVMVSTNGASTATPGMLHRTQPGAIHVTAQTATKTIYTLCAASAGACNTAGQYGIDWYFNQGGTACATPGTGGVTFALTWVDNAGTHSAVALPMDDASSLTATGTKFTFQTSNTAAWASGHFNIWSTGASAIQITNTYTACGVGTGTWELAATATRMQ